MSSKGKAITGGIEAYRQLCTEVEDIQIFAQAWYLDALPDYFSWDAVIVEEKGRVFAALPYVIRKRFGLTLATMPALVKMLGPWLAPEKRSLSDQHKYYRILIEGLPMLASFDQGFHYRVTNWLPFYWKGFQQTTRYSYQLQLDDLERGRSGIKGNVRREIQKAGEWVAVRHDLGLKEFYRVAMLSFERQGMKNPYSFEYLKKLDDALIQHNARELFFAVDQDGKVHSVVYLIWDRMSSYFHIAGDDPDLRDSNASKLLVWEAIQYTREVLHLPVFDFEGSMLPSVEPLRRRFGAEQVPYLRVWKDWSWGYGLWRGLKDRIGGFIRR